MPTPPTYTNAFRVVGSAAEIAPVSGGQPSWGFFRSAPIGVYSQVNYATGTSSYDYIYTAYAGSSAMTTTLYRTWYPFELQFVFNSSSGFLPSGVVVRGWQSSNPDDADYPNVAEEDFTGGCVGATVTALGGATFTLTAEAGNHNGVAQDTVTLSGPPTVIVLP